MSPDGSHVAVLPLTPGFRTGAYITASLGLASAASVLALALYLGIVALDGRGLDQPAARHVRAFFRTDFGLYLSSLLLLQFTVGVGFVCNFSWAATGFVREGSLCDFQGVTKMASTLGLPLLNLALATQTVWTFVFLRATAPATKWIVTFLLWLGLMLPNIAGTIGNARAGLKFTYWGPVAKGCTIRTESASSQGYLRYIAIVNALIVGLILLLYLLTSITLALGPRRGHSQTLSAGASSEARMKATKSVAYRMLLFPLLSILTNTPNAALALYNVVDPSRRAKTPAAVSMVTTALIASSGILEVLLFLITRPALIAKTGVAGAIVDALTRHKDRKRSLSIATHEPAMFVELSQMKFSEGSGEERDIEAGLAVEISPPRRAI